ncbi:hypothetical protein [Nocardia alba]|uniref:SseB protein N-terminal domain-containing protein n=1 Tax=Nocardia alba TaxID=225051 RepID=A0A4R1FPH3_9NOCA|nr:hypothetical protein [Nocardia alba]TCJ95394.1 hypothetical protein DFR71_4309 [Nocardia alba]
MSDGDGRDRLRAEIAAFYAGFGQPAALLAAFQQAALLVPLTADDRVYFSPLGGVDWLCTFTSIEEYALFMAARGHLQGGGIDGDREYRYHWLFGRRLQEYVESRAEPAGIAIDIVGSAPMAFPPDVAG